VKQQKGSGSGTLAEGRTGAKESGKRPTTGARMQEGEGERGPGTKRAGYWLFPEVLTILDQEQARRRLAGNRVSLSSLVEEAIRVAFGHGLAHAGAGVAAEGAAKYGVNRKKRARE